MSDESELIHCAEHAVCDELFVDAHHSLVLLLGLSSDYPNPQVHRLLAQALYDVDTRQVPATLRTLALLRSYYRA